MDGPKDTQIAPQKNNLKHNISIYIYIKGIYSQGHEFGVFTILPKCHLYSELCIN
jgi:hypothetical protein